MCIYLYWLHQHLQRNSKLGSDWLMGDYMDGQMDDGCMDQLMDR